MLVDALLAQQPAVDVFVGLSWRDLPIPEEMRVVSYGALGRLGRLPALEVVPCHYSALPRLFASRELPGDALLIQVAPPDAHGRCSFGVGVDYLADAVEHARVIIAEVNDHCPRTAGEWIAWDRLDVVVHTSRPLLEAPAAEPGPTELAIAEHVAGLVADGDTITLGVGALPEAILGRLGGHRDLGVHSGMISDGVLRLIEAGAVTNARKPADTGTSVTGAALGSVRLFDALADHEEIVFRPASYTHAASTLARVGRLVAINSAVEIDLHGAGERRVRGRPPDRRGWWAGRLPARGRGQRRQADRRPARAAHRRAAERPGQHVAQRRRLGRDRARRALAGRALGRRPGEGAARARRRSARGGTSVSSDGVGRLR